MTRVLTLFATVIITAMLWAQSPDKMSYQAVVRNTNHALVINQTVGMQISILQGSASGTAVYVETQTPTTNANGLITVEIGGGTVVNGSFAGINWASGPYYIKTETDPAGGTDYTVVGISQFLSVPYAQYAKTAGSVSYANIAAKPENIDEDKTDDVLLTGNQTIAGNKTFTGATAVANPVNATDATNKAYVDALLSRVKWLEAADAIHHGFTDPRDGNYYKTVKIGNQIWMAENLRYLPNVVGPATGSATTPYCYVYGYNDTSVAEAKATDNYKTYGVLYNWAAAMAGATSSEANPSGVQGICPPGWHLPSEAEWAELEFRYYSVGISNIGDRLKETGIAHWIGPNTATNETGFTALPGGYRSIGGTFIQLGIECGFWTATEDVGQQVWTRLMYDDSPYMSAFRAFKTAAYSIRCVRDY